MRQKALSNGGYTRVIVVGPTLKNEAAMWALGETLKEDTRTDRNAIVFVFHYARAADMIERAREDKLNERDASSTTLSSTRAPSTRAVTN